MLDRVGGPPGEVTLHTRAYRPTRRAVVEVALGADGGRVLYLKVLGGRTPKRVHERTEALAEVHRRLGRHLPVPRLVGTSAGQGLIAMTALSGRTLRTLVVNGPALPDPAELVDLTRRLARIRGVTSGTDPRRYADITRHVRHLAHLLPDQEPLLTRIAAKVATLGGPVGTVHGDLHDGQLLFDADVTLTGVLDVDGAGPGDLASDAGRLVAHIEAADLVADVAPPARDYPERLWEAYRDLVDPRETAKAAAAAWVGLATGPYRAHQPDWQEATRARLARAAAWLERVG
jgi:aminoglycoside phosphotransferase (APT) family kinase protein